MILTVGASIIIILIAGIMFVGRSEGPEIRHGEAHILVHTLSAQTANCRSTDAICPLYTRFRYVPSIYTKNANV